MEEGGNALLGDIVERVRSWIPRISSSSNNSYSNREDEGSPKTMSRDFWMPDRSCRMCYDCDSQFTIFNRRHHCRMCGRVFCGKCTLNTISASLDGRGGGAHGAHGTASTHEDGNEKVRVCNYCFKRYCEQNGGSDANNNLALQASMAPPPPASSSPLMSSPSGGHTSHRSNGLQQGGGTGAASSPVRPALNSQRASSNGSLIRGSLFADDSSKQGWSVCEIFGCCRSDDEEDYDQNGEQSHQDIDYEYGSGIELDLGDFRHPKHNISNDSSLSLVCQTTQSDETFNSSRGIGSESLLMQESVTRMCDDIESMDEEPPMYEEAEPSQEAPEQPAVDCENSGLIWVPPPPEDDEDEVGTSMVDDDEDEDGAGWLPRSPGSVSSSEYRSKAAMRAIVDGHFRALVAQLLKGEDVQNIGEEGDPGSWLEIVSALALQAANLVKPDTSKDGGMDPGGYVKVKCVASGKCQESVVVRGVVCRKNVQHRRMTSRFKNPRLLLLGGALEYQRVTNQLSSLETLLQQEKDHLSMAVARIEAHHPNILLVEKTVSRFAQDRLLAREISVVLNVKRPLLERIAQCTGAQVVPSPDNLSAPKTGQCEHFHIEKFVEEHDCAIGQGGRKSPYLMFFEGCPRPLGCTVLLRGASTEELKKVKKVVQFAVFAAYHLALETSFLADEGATLPELPLESPISVVIPARPRLDRSISSIPGFTIPSASGQSHVRPVQFYTERCAYSNPTSFVGNFDTQIEKLKLSSGLSLLKIDQECAVFTTTAIHGHVKGLGESSSEVELGVADMESQVLHGKIIEGLEPQPAQKDDFPPSPSDHQSILVSLSSQCLSCERPRLKRIKYYGPSDKPLGKFLKDSLFNASNGCGLCGEPLDPHVQCYTHRQGSLTISVHHLKDIVLGGEKDGKIWMWHRCLRCAHVNGVPPSTRRVVMSDAAWGLSFGKFLELSFSNHAAASRVAACGHSLHRDCLRFYGFGNVVACFRYAPIKLYSVYVPPPQLEFNNPDQQEWLREEASEVADKGNLVFAEVFNTLRDIGEKISNSRSFYASGKVPEARRRIVEFETLLQKEKAEFEAQLQRAGHSNPQPGEPVVDILELNNLQRLLGNISSNWDKRFQSLVPACQLQRLPSGSDAGFVDDPTIISPRRVTTVITNGKVTHVVEGLTSSKNEAAIDGDSVQERQLRVQSHDGESDGCSPLGSDGLDQSSGLSLLLDGECGARRSLSEEHFPILANLSNRLDAAWTGEGIPIGPCTVHATPTVEGTDSRGATVPCGVTDGEVVCSQSDQLDLRMISKLKPVNCKVGVGVGDPSALTSPLKGNDREKDGIEDTRAWVGGFPSSSQKAMSRSGSTKSSVIGSPPRADLKWLPSTPILSSQTGQMGVQEAARYHLPTGINDTVVAVFDDEPTSIIAYALLSHEYQVNIEGVHTEMEKEQPREKSKDKDENSEDMRSLSHPIQLLGGVAGTNLGSDLSKEKIPANSRAPELSTAIRKKEAGVDMKPLHVKVHFADTVQQRKMEFRVTCYYAKQFDSLRKKCCGGDLEYVRSMSRCKKWGAHGGKSNVFFAKTMDDRFVVKQVKSTEKISFLEFAPEYFKYLSDYLDSGSPTCLAKILGVYTVTVKHSKGGKEMKMDLLVMENLLYARHITRLYDLKGSARSRYNSDSSGSNKVLLDQNLLEAMPMAPIFVGNKAKRLLERAVWNDTAFLAGVDVMDYSLLVGVDEERQELVLGIIDFIRQYTWDKHLETWVKASGILGGPKNAPPTVISPKQYKKRFRKAMSTYFVMVPDQWTPSLIPGTPPSSDSSQLKELETTYKKQGGAQTGNEI
ncbi:unnamed protein product [Sphagnum jensenii]|uniref:1-phosphatidylinositol-3-phosphate 5-kinase n=1 Tax=Sphagnum jensenii TaxID=128206 RepID=A0ABP1B2X7_9BRYO